MCPCLWWSTFPILFSLSHLLLKANNSDKYLNKRFNNTLHLGLRKKCWGNITKIVYCIIQKLFRKIRPIYYSFVRKRLEEDRWSGDEDLLHDCFHISWPEKAISDQKWQALRREQTDMTGGMWPQEANHSNWKRMWESEEINVRQKPGEDKNVK